MEILFDKNALEPARNGDEVGRGISLIFNRISGPIENNCCAFQPIQRYRPTGDGPKPGNFLVASGFISRSSIEFDRTVAVIPARLIA
jgi:hypothetical protein